MKEIYLGDGLTAHYDGVMMITLRTERQDGEHWVGLEREVFQELLQFAIDIGWLGERGRK